MAGALVAVAAVLFAAIHYGEAIPDRVAHESDEVLLLTTLGGVLLVAGLAQKFQVSSVVGAFLMAWLYPDPSPNAPTACWRPCAISLRPCI
jgi:CPA2 family monovalent cation:H+ antiporter-2